MATSEPDIRKGVALLLRQYGSLTTNEVKQLLETVMPFDEDDMRMSHTRNEILIMQRIGNIVSHQKEDVQEYEDSYIIDKTQKPAIWSALKGLKSLEGLKPISDNEVNHIQKVRNNFSPQKIEWDAINYKKTETGRQGEEFVIRFETNRIIHLSEEQGDGAGFDILSINEDGSDRYIEVKTTKGSENTPFYLSENERAFLEAYKDMNCAFIYRVFNFDPDSFNKKGEVKIISAIELFNEYELDPVSYRVVKK